MIKTIKKFSEMLPINNGLYVFDIDETFMVFQGITDQWWEKEYNALLGRYPKEKAERLMDEKFRKKISYGNPKPTDLNGFKDIEKRSKLLNNDIIFLTARTEDYREITLKQLEYIYPGINYHVYFSSEKGKTLKEIIDNSEKIYDVSLDIKQQLEKYAQKCGVPICEYLNIPELENYIKWIHD